MSKSESKRELCNVSFSYYVRSAARLLDRDCVNKGGLDLSKEVLWVSVDQRAAELRAVKIVFFAVKSFHDRTYLFTSGLFIFYVANIYLYSKFSTIRMFHYT